MAIKRKVFLNFNCNYLYINLAYYSILYSFCLKAYLISKPIY